ncbi:MAG: bile acid:sodium symporter family protein [Paludibacteraceae bacterium]|nr:bile acid:sodium symporter family protein [Paludibacteraceae bacterium]
MCFCVIFVAVNKVNDMVKRICDFISSFMGVIILLSAFLALFFPSFFAFIPSSIVNPMLGLVMLGMGLTLEPSDFKTILSRPRDVVVGSVTQFVVMPLLAYGLTVVFSLPTEIALGVVLVGCCPGGTASNVITYLSKGDLSLSVAMTTLSTLLAPFLTPFLTWFLIRQSVDVDTASMFLSILFVVLLPVVLGLAIRHFFPKFTKSVSTFLPSFSVLVIALLVMIVVSANSAKLFSCGFIVVLVVVLHNLLGLLLGYVVAKVFKMNRAKAKALSVEVGMQNSGLASSLALTSFAQYPIAAVPGAVFSVWHNISGAIVARVYSSIPNDDASKK